MEFLFASQLDFLTGTETLRGLIPRPGTGMGKEVPPRAFTGPGTEISCPRGDGDGEPNADGDFPVAIWTSDNRTGQSLAA